MSVNTKMTAIADPIRALKGTSGKMGLDVMASNLGEVVNECNTQADLITQIKTALADKAAGGGGSNQPLTFTGAVNATYDGSQAVSVKIPVGGGSSGGLMGVEHTLLNTTVEIPADSPVTRIELDVPEVAKTCKAFQIFVYLSKPTNEHTATRTQVSICRHNLIYWNIGHTSATSAMGYWIIADCIKGIAYKKASPNSFSANSNPFNCESASGLKKFPPSNSNNKFVFEMFSPYAGTVNIEVYGYN